MRIRIELHALLRHFERECVSLLAAGKHDLLGG
jgi:hypothetical protein